MVSDLSVVVLSELSVVVLSSVSTDPSSSPSVVVPGPDTVGQAGEQRDDLQEHFGQGTPSSLA